MYFYYFVLSIDTTLLRFLIFFFGDCVFLFEVTFIFFISSFVTFKDLAFSLIAWEFIWLIFSIFNGLLNSWMFALSLQADFILFSVDLIFWFSLDVLPKII